MHKTYICFRLLTGSLLLLLTMLLHNGFAASDSIAEIHSDLEATCFDCHEEDQPHEGSFGEDCSLCHAPEAGWDTLDFDHGLARFPLIGSHNEVDCESCHSEAPASSGIRSCKDCHLEDEPHEQVFGQNCSRCHNPNGWEHWQFDHNKQTGFHLEGAHQGLVCSACHKNPITMESHISKDCVDCHQKDDQHRGAFGFNCDRCHQPTEFIDVKITK